MQFGKNIHSWFFQWHQIARVRKHQIALVLRTRAILVVFEKLTRACFFQIALETILLPIYTNWKGLESPQPVREVFFHRPPRLKTLIAETFNDFFVTIGSKTSKSTGIDMIPARVLKISADIIAPSITWIFNLSLKCQWNEIFDPFFVSLNESSRF